MKGDHSPKELHCFKREIENTARLEDPRIVKIIEYYLETAPYWIVMPLYKMSLKEMLPTIKGASQRTLKVFGAILDGVEFAHAQQIVHRDLKPGSVLANSDDDIVIADCGFCKPLGRETSCELGLIRGLERMATWLLNNSSRLRVSTIVQTFIRVEEFFRTYTAV